MPGFILSSPADAQFAGTDFIHLETVDSTNTFCLENPDMLSRPGLVVFADWQEAGRGRMGRQWSQGVGGHLFASFVIHPDLSPVLIPSITLCAGLAVYRVLARKGIPECSLKWPNDILVNGRKVCGILCESRITRDGVVVVAGIGINIAAGPEQFPEDISGSIATLEECGVKISRDRLLRAVALSFDEILKDIHSGRGPSLFKEWESVSGSLGRRVRFNAGHDRIRGIIHGIDSCGRLVVRDDAGKFITVLSGEVEYI